MFYWTIPSGNWQLPGSTSPFFVVKWSNFDPGLGLGELRAPASLGPDRKNRSASMMMTDKQTKAKNRKFSQREYKSSLRSEIRKCSTETQLVQMYFSRNKIHTGENILRNVIMSASSEASCIVWLQWYSYSRILARRTCTPKLIRYFLNRDVWGIKQWREP